MIGRSKLKVSTQPVAGHTLSLTLASVEVSHSDSNEYKNMAFTNEDKIFIKISRQERRHGAKEILREFVCIVHAHSRCRYLMTHLIEEWRLFDQQIMTEQSNSGFHVFDQMFVKKEDTSSISYA